MVIGITGVNGYIGNYLSKYLLDKGYNVCGLVRSSDLSSELRNSDISTVVGDLCSPDTCLSFVKEVDVIIHLAHSSIPLSENEDLSEGVFRNVVPSLNLIQAILLSGKSVKLIYASSGGTVYGRSVSRQPFCENDFCQPECIYGIQKYTIENYITYYSNMGFFDSFILRISNPYGSIPSIDRKQGLIGVVLGRFHRGKPIQVFGDPNNVRDYIHLEDLCDLVAICIHRKEKGCIYNVGSGVGASVNEVLNLLESYLKTRFVRETIINDKTKRLIDWSVLDIKKAQKELGWSPRILLDVGVGELCRLYSNR